MVRHHSLTSVSGSGPRASTGTGHRWYPATWAREGHAHAQGSMHTGKPPNQAHFFNDFDLGQPVPEDKARRAQSSSLPSWSLFSHMRPQGDGAWIRPPARVARPGPTRPHQAPHGRCPNQAPPGRNPQPRKERGVPRILTGDFRSFLGFGRAPLTLQKVEKIGRAMVTLGHIFESRF